ncbi:unnamed protein product [Rhizoctonia solani]|uniref:Uncharacterized protein n=1 Tax=Rhizoctonia solani TaxID=456999 RepID=A0A8H2WI42_9AGAM|nr:unnamed protein product [Rhizoctonia solani]
MAQLQPEWPIITNAFTDLEHAGAVLREQVPRIANIPVPNNIAQIQAMLVAMEARLAASITGVRNDVTQLQNGLNARIDLLTQVVQVNELNGRARAVNASVKDELSPITPLVRSNGDQLPPGLFPATCGEFRALNGQRLTDLLQQYNLNVPAGAPLADRRRCLSQHCAVSL